jgi:Cu/Ag efflux protein CusF
VRPTWLRIALAAGAALALACGGDAETGEGTGVVRALGADGSTVTLEHGDIPGLMRAMTMEFAVAKPELLGGVEVGDRVDFHLVYAEGRYTITELREKPAP